MKILLAAVSTLIATGLTGLEASAETPGYNALFIGHSFFRPFADGMDDHAEEAGIEGHSQEVVFSGGAGGAPMALWNNSGKRAEIQGILDGGDIEFFAMTYHPDYPTTEGYENWIDYALAQNPDTKIAIGLPWGPYPATSSTEDYVAGWLAFHETAWHDDLIATLRELYPETEISCLPYGRSASELRLLHSAGNLPDVTAMTGSAGSSIYTDSLGHAGHILRDLGRLVWLNAIYDVDLTTYAHDPGYITDLKAIAQSIMDWHRADFPLPLPGGEITTIRTTRFTMKDDPVPPIQAKKRRFSFKSSTYKGNPSEVVAPVPGEDSDPTAAGSTGGGAVLTLYPSSGTTDDAVVFDLPAARWERAGSASRPNYRYDDRHLADGPIRKVRLRDGKLIVTGKGEGLYTLDEAPQGAMAMRLALGTGTILCAEAGVKAPEYKNDTTARFVGDKSSGAPGPCPPLEAPDGSASRAFLSLTAGLLD